MRLGGDMVQNLYAFCRPSGGPPVIKRLALAQSVQNDVAQLFAKQEHDFRAGVISEVVFDGGWVPEDDEFLTLDANPHAQPILTALGSNATSLPLVSHSGFQSENIKAIFVARGTGTAQKILIQRFTSQQILSRGFSLMLDNNVFNRLSELSFSLDSQLTCIIESGTLKFKSFFKLNRVFDLDSLLKASTDDEVKGFLAHKNIHTANPAAFLDHADQAMRKAIHACLKDKILEKYTPKDIGKAAKNEGLKVAFKKGKIVMPDNKKEAKKLIFFLNDSFYKAALSGRSFITNSKREP